MEKLLNKQKITSDIMKKEILIGFMFLMLMSIVYADTPTGRISESVNLQVTLLNQNPDPVQPGSYVEIRFQAENLGVYDAKDVVFELLPSYPFKLEPGDSTKREIGTLKGRATGQDAAVVYYKLIVDKDAVEGDNELDLRYSLDDGKSWVLLDEFDIRVQTIDAVVGITSVETVPKKLEPGKVGKIMVELQNMADSLTEDIALKFDFSSDDMPFVPVNSASEKKIRSLAAGESTKFEFDIMVLADAESQTYKVPIEVRYIDESDTLYNKTDIIGVVVGSTPEMDVYIEDQTVYSSASSGEVSVKFVNKGVTDIKFLSVELAESDDLQVISTPLVYIGDLDSDDYENADFNIYVKKTKEDYVQIPLKLEYADANNEEFVQEVDLQMRLYSGAELKKFGLVKSSKTGLIIIILVVVGGGIYLYRKKKKKKS
ncbi:MAG: hypothetical protein MAG795_00605 [Candidatus Woesearchaeota archaeon]|nr:hypothetical protein [Candidatus Woesearchaeota archaeon]